MRNEALWQVDESQLSFADRLGLAWCRLNSWEWDEYVGPKPENFDILPNHVWRTTMFGKKQKSKQDYIRPAMRAIESIIGKPYALRCSWIFGSGKTDREWVTWYVSVGYKIIQLESAISSPRSIR